MGASACLCKLFSLPSGGAYLILCIQCGELDLGALVCLLELFFVLHLLLILLRKQQLELLPVNIHLGCELVCG